MNAGKVLRESIPVDGSKVSDDIIEAFRIAHAWRHSFEAPMRDVRQELSFRNTKLELGGSTAGRLKRMTSIRRKLKSRSLYQIQDIGGCRIILPCLAEVQIVSDYYLEGQSRHEFLSEDNYISNPRATGYRSRHFILKVAGFPDDRQRIEVQVRTRLQHAWATAVEAAGLWLGQNLKAGEGDSRWLELFALMSQFITEEEGTHSVPGIASSAVNRKARLRELEADIDAIATLDGLRSAFKSIHPTRASGLLLLEFDATKKRLTVSNYSWASSPDRYAAAERDALSNSVVVDVDSIEDLKAAYPNYFLDVEMFVQRLRSATGFSISAPTTIKFPPGAWRRK